VKAQVSTYDNWRFEFPCLTHVTVIAGSAPFILLPHAWKFIPVEGGRAVC
jgi:hypothetical protein